MPSFGEKRKVSKKMGTTEHQGIPRQPAFLNKSEYWDTRMPAPRCTTHPVYMEYSSDGGHGHLGSADEFTDTDEAEEDIVTFYDNWEAHSD